MVIKLSHDRDSLDKIVERKRLNHLPTWEWTRVASFGECGFDG